MCHSRLSAEVRERGRGKREEDRKRDGVTEGQTEGAGRTGGREEGGTATRESG